MKTYLVTLYQAMEWRAVDSISITHCVVLIDVVFEKEVVSHSNVDILQA